MIDIADLDNRFNYHAPDEKSKERHQHARNVMLAAAEEVLNLTPPSREQSLAITALEEAMFWTNAAIARMEINGERK